MILFILACSHPTLTIELTSSPTTSSSFIAYDGTLIELEEGRIEVTSIDLLAQEEELAWMPSVFPTAYAHGEGGTRLLGSIEVSRSMQLLNRTMLGEGEIELDTSLSAEVHLQEVVLRGTARPPSGPIDFEVDLPVIESIVGVRASFEVDGEPLDVHIGLPALFAQVDWSADDDGNGRLDANDPTFMNTVLFGVRSAATFTVRPAAHSTTERALAIVDTPGNHERGAGLYQQHCGSCHGSEAEGGIGPELSSHLNGQARLDVIDYVLVGSERMPGFNRMSDQELADLLAYSFANHR